MCQLQKMECIPFFSLIKANILSLIQDYGKAIIISLMVVLGHVLLFVQEYRADTAAAKLRAK